MHLNICYVNLRQNKCSLFQNSKDLPSKNPYMKLDSSIYEVWHLQTPVLNL